jgi:hypothetical protein
MLSLWFLATSAQAQTCASPLSIACNATSRQLTGGATDATNDRGSYPCGASYGGGDQVFEFTPPAGQRVYVDLDPNDSSGLTQNYLDLIVIDGACGGGTCADSSTNSNENLEHTNWVADGGTYYLWVDRDTSVLGSAAREYRIQTGCPTTCDTATEIFEELSCSSDLVGQTTASGTTDVLEYYACGAPFPNTLQRAREKIYSFSPNVTGSVTFELDNMTTDHDIYVLEGSCDTSECLTGSTQALTANDSVTFTALSGQTYMI